MDDQRNDRKGGGMLKSLRVTRWLMIGAWVIAFAGCLNAAFHVSDRDPKQWGAALFSVLCILFAGGASVIYLIALLANNLLARRKK